ncbi:hypothetical protein MLGJGCBP_00244 [Rhodococcus sp. T7]|nr:hypothetical protein MLGJGCBP_00244 [Rhodococcus sp. T7]
MRNSRLPRKFRLAAGLHQDSHVLMDQLLPGWRRLPDHGRAADDPPVPILAGSNGTDGQYTQACCVPITPDFWHQGVLFARLCPAAPIAMSSEKGQEVETDHGGHTVRQPTNTQVAASQNVAGCETPKAHVGPRHPRGQISCAVTGDLPFRQSILPIQARLATVCSVRDHLICEGSLGGQAISSTARPTWLDRPHCVQSGCPHNRLLRTPVQTRFIGKERAASLPLNPETLTGTPEIRQSQFLGPGHSPLPRTIPCHRRCSRPTRGRLVAAGAQHRRFRPPDETLWTFRRWCGCSRRRPRNDPPGHADGHRQHER